jgi:hypothetical protein
MLKLNSKLAHTATFCAVAVLSTSAGAQAIEVKQQAFADEVPLPFVKPPAPLVVPLPTDQKGVTWEIKLQDINLANSIQRWANAAGWRVRWDARKHVMIEAPDQISGSFEDAVRTVLEAPGIAASSYPLEVCFYPNTPPLARITLKGDQDKECK